ncbi:hypothetical protein KFE25_007191 [Diacronema lutheri]|uniref:THUMP domain-containing protein n=1 Tax=Diacronema lutheri TaxID=2081491 RepID=A0A8J5XXJ8_DIALT|nr:hypothetical protein KFE25_007191 [Diacronema lutheri]
MPAKKRKAGAQGWRASRPKHVQESELNVGTRGVMITCDTHAEKGAVREGFDVLAQAWDLLAPPRVAAAQDVASGGGCDGEGGGAGESSGVIDIAREIAAESAALSEGRRFFVAQTGCAGFVVLRLNAALADGASGSPSLLELVNRVYASVATDGELAVRFVARMLPCQTVCRAELPKIATAVRETVAAEVKRRGAGACPATFAVQFRQRHNTKALDRDEVIRVVADSAKLELGSARVHIADPELCVVLEVVKAHCCVCVVDQWQKYKRYSLRALQGADGGEQPPSAAPAAASAPAGGSGEE